MLSLTRKTEYALIAVCHLARVGERVVSAREIAEAHNVPLPLLMNVLKVLNRTRHVRSVRGAHGGYVLGVDPRELTLAGLIEAVEGPVNLVRCVAPASNGRLCDLTHSCTIRRAVVRVHDRLKKFLTGVTIADLASDHPPLRGLETSKVMAR